MDIDTTRRALVAAIVGGGAVGGSLSPVRGYLQRFAPFSGTAWRDATDETNRRVESPYGEATVRYDDYGTPHVEAGDEAALYFAVGYVQAADRLFQMDLQRRVMRGRLSEVVGEATLDSDEFHAKMDFVGAAEANLELFDGDATADAIDCFVDGVNACIDREALPVEFGLLEYDPDPWTAADTMLMETQISWGLTGNFGTLRRELLAEKFDESTVSELYPARLDHDAPIIRDGGGASPSAAAGTVSPSGEFGGASGDREFLDWLSRFESPPGIGSNSWVVSGEHTDSGKPIVANDPHLTLMAPPVWYEMNLRTDDLSVRGVTFPGVPFVVIGENDRGAWGFTNAGADVIDFYRYETRADGSEYRYRGEWREFDTEERTVGVSGGEDRTVTVKKTVHGPVIERHGRQVGVSWTGHTATETSRAIHEYSRAGGVDDFLAATRKMDLPTQNVVYADRAGNTLYYVTGRIPRRTIDGEEVWGARVFDGSSGEAEWEGFEPFGVSSWEGFVPFEEKPHVKNPDYLGTANQRIVDDPAHYIGERYSQPYRGQRLYELLDRRAASGKPMTPQFMRRLQRDAYSKRAEQVTPLLVAAADGHEGLADAVATLRDWDYRMVRDSRAALVFATWFDRYREAVFGDEFESKGLGEEYYPSDWVLARLDADSRWFGDEGRDTVMVRALRETLGELDDGATYGDVNTTAAITHPLDQSFLNYRALPTDGSPYTLNNYREESAVGSSWRMISPMDADADSACVLPGGNSGEYFSEHYADQLRMWADGEYKPMRREVSGETATRFEETGGEGR
ncbi:MULTISPECIES: penicillin acylase family protein [Halorussus]|uniref:penicillin acylase family protein n=1 Tax=Halorussus TaxID=1070314 RepID=UPI0020A2267A|nr:penicillin acylase family protein [Halorussus vallis]USZ76349.1 penicillin acylase family protein [Halorussus vallis]